ncbi:MAG: ATP-binding protein [Planctomycetota bacterium]|nr:ATP-binding protein [Planctomycetota bacterium]
MFIGRQRELSALEELAESGQPELFVLYGRRRVGKTELLQQFCQGRRGVYFLAAQVREKDNLRAFRDALKDGLGDELAGAVDFPDWHAALSFAAERAGDERLVLVLDEFPYLCETSKGLPSQVQRFWDTRGKRSSLMLILCGSQVSFMEREVLAERSPLFGRRTGQRRLEPLEPADTLAFFPRWKMRERVLAFGILGGMPAYLRRFDDGRSLEENICRDILRPEGYLFDEVQFLLKSELTNPATYNSILASVARGTERVGDIALDVGVDSTTANKYLHVLRELRLVEREIPVTDPDPLRSRRGTYRIADRFLAFHFRHVQPNLSLIHADRGARVMEEFVGPDLPRIFDEARTDFILSHLRRKAADLLGSEIIEVGRFAGRHIRAVARLSAGGTVAALAWAGTDTQRQKTLKSPVLAAELAELERAFGSAPTVLAYHIVERHEDPLDAEIIAPGLVK